METYEGFWYSVGDAFHAYFRGMEWANDTVLINKLLIVVGFVAFAAWMRMQINYNKKALKENTLI